MKPRGIEDFFWYLLFMDFLNAFEPSTLSADLFVFSSAGANCYHLTGRHGNTRAGAYRRRMSYAALQATMVI